MFGMIREQPFDVVVDLHAFLMGQKLHSGRFVLQGLADRKAKDLEVIAGGAPAAIEYIVVENERLGHEYTYDQVEAVLHLEARYLASIGAIGDPIGEVEL